MSNLGASSTSISGSGSGSVISLGSSCSSNWTIQKNYPISASDILQLRLPAKSTRQSLYIEGSVGSKAACRVLLPEHLVQPCSLCLCESGLFLHTQRVSFLHQHVPKLFTKSFTEFYKIPPTSKHLNLTVQNPSGPQMEDLPSMVVPVVGNEALELPLEAPHPAKRHGSCKHYSAAHRSQATHPLCI